MALAPLVLAAQATTIMRAGFLGWIAGTIAFNGLTSSSVHEALVRAQHPGWLAAIEAFLVPQLTGALHMAAFSSYVAALERRWHGRPARLFVVAAAWVTAELARARIGHGMPWVLLAHSQTSQPIWLQVAALAGTAGSSFVLALASASVATTLTDRRDARPRSLVAALGAATGVLALAYGYGSWAMVRWQNPAGRTLRLALVQGDVPPAWRYSLPRIADTLTRYAGLVAEAAATHPDLVVLPENAVAIAPDANPRVFATITTGLVGSRTELLIGAPRELRLAPDRATTRNSAYLLDSAGNIQGVYDKRHLVPFGETSTWLLPGRLPWWIGRTNAYSAGDAQELLSVAGVRFATSICWEGIYSDPAREAVGAGAEFVVNLSNDDWFGPHAATEQHFRATLMRSVEMRRFLLRVTNSGLTGVVDPRGVVVIAAPPEKAAVVPAEIVPLTGLTPFARMGDAFAWGCALATLLALGSGRPPPEARRP